MFKDIGAYIKKEDIKFAHRLGAMTDTVATKPRPLRMSLRTLEQRVDFQQSQESSQDQVQKHQCRPGPHGHAEGLGQWPHEGG